MEIVRREFRGRDTRKTRERRAKEEKNAPEKKTNLNKKKGKRQEKDGNPNAIKSPTMAPAEKVFTLPENAAEENQPKGWRGAGERRGAGCREVEAKEEEGVRGRKTRRREDRGRSGEEGLKLLADISSGEQAR